MAARSISKVEIEEPDKENLRTKNNFFIASGSKEPKRPCFFSDHTYD
jgi:3-phenylpropionate/cinnamic acid dioxygenase small subunit